MPYRPLEFMQLSKSDRAKLVALPAARRGRRVEVSTGNGRKALPPKVARLVESFLDRLGRGEKLALVSAGSPEVSPNEAAAILGMSRPMVVHRMDVGDLPFRYVGAHRRARLDDVLALRARLGRQRKAIGALAAATERLIRDHGL